MKFFCIGLLLTNLWGLSALAADFSYANQGKKKCSECLDWSARNFIYFKESLMRMACCDPPSFGVIKSALADKYQRVDLVMAAILFIKYKNQRYSNNFFQSFLDDIIAEGRCNNVLLLRDFMATVHASKNIRHYYYILGLLSKNELISVLDSLRFCQLFLSKTYFYKELNRKNLILVEECLRPVLHVLVESI